VRPEAELPVSRLPEGNQAEAASWLQQTGLSVERAEQIAEEFGPRAGQLARMAVGTDLAG
jgi:hypothetical protein